MLRATPARSFLVAALALTLTACGDSSREPPDAKDAASGDGAAPDGEGPRTEPRDGGGDAGDGAAPAVDYSQPDSWLCGPLAAHDYCRDPLTGQRVTPDGALEDVAFDAAVAPGLDCFYVYPTVAITAEVGNVETFDVPNILDPLKAQAVPLRQACSLFAPFYHQTTLATYRALNSADYLEVAYAEIARAFRYYLEHLSEGRRFVLVGHSQGAHLLRRLMQREIETDDALLARLALALPIGALGDIVVPEGEVVGGTFTRIPLCTGDDQQGCVLSYATFAEGYGPTTHGVPDGMEAACTNPAALGGGAARFASSTFAVRLHQAILDPQLLTEATADLAVYDDLFTGECTRSATGFTYLEIAADPLPGDTRTNPVPFGGAILSPGPPYYLGTHLLDFAFPMAELVEAVKRRAAP